MRTYQETDTYMRVANALVMGVVSEVDLANWKVRVSIGDLETDWIDWNALRAGSVRKWSPPSAGEQVLLACPFGDLTQAKIIGSFFQDAFPPPSSSPDEEVTQFSDGTLVSYNTKTGNMSINISGESSSVNVTCKSAIINAETSINGNLTVSGKISANGEITSGSIGLTSHHHTAQGANSPTTEAQQ